MALIPIRIDRTSKPPLGTPLRSDGHWSVQGLVGAWAFNEGAGLSVIDSKTGRVGSLSANGCGFTPNGISLDGSSGYINLGTQPKLTGGSHSFIVSFKSTAGTYGSICSLGNYYSSGFDWRRNDTNSINFAYYGTGTRGWYSSSPLAIGTSTTIGMAFDANNYKIIVGDKSNYIEVATYNESTLYNSSAYLLIGDDISNHQRLASAGINFVFAYNLALFPQQIASLSANPWQIYEPETVWIEVGGGGEAALFAGSIYGQSSASALLTSAIRMAASAQGYGASTAALNTTIALASEILAASSASGALSTAIKLGGAVSGGASTTTAALTNAITMAAQAAGLGSIGGQLAGTVAAALFAGTISGSSSASANLSTAVVLAAAAQGSAAAQAALSTALELAAQVNGIGSAVGTLGSDISGLAGSLSGSSEAQATLSTAIHLMGLADGQCGVAGRLAEPVEILAQLRVMASDPLALTIYVRDPLTLRVTVQ